MLWNKQKLKKKLKSILCEEKHKIINFSNKMIHEFQFSKEDGATIWNIFYNNRK